MTNFTIQLCDADFMGEHLNQFIQLHYDIWHRTYDSIENIPPEFLANNDIFYFKEHWEEVRNNTNSSTLAALDGNNLIGFAVVKHAITNIDRIQLAGLDQTDVATGELQHINIDQNHSGFGRSLFTLAAQEVQSHGAQQMIIDVYSGNKNALGFYAHIGCANGEKYIDHEERYGETHETPSILLRIDSLNDFLSTPKAKSIIERHNPTNITPPQYWDNIGVMRYGR